MQLPILINIPTNPPSILPLHIHELPMEISKFLCGLLLFDDWLMIFVAWFVSCDAWFIESKMLGCDRFRYFVVISWLCVRASMAWWVASGCSHMWLPFSNKYGGFGFLFIFDIIAFVIVRMIQYILLDDQYFVCNVI